MLKEIIRAVYAEYNEGSFTVAIMDQCVGALSWWKSTNGAIISSIQHQIVQISIAPICDCPSLLHIVNENYALQIPKNGGHDLPSW